MELREVVKATIEQIVEGAATAREAVSARGAMINPAGVQLQKDGTWNTYNDSMQIKNSILL